VGVPLLALVAVDRAIVGYRPHWEWVVREVAPNQVDTYRVEAILRTTPRDAGNVAILGDSTALAALDAPTLDEAFADRGRHFVPITVGGTQTVSFGFLTNAILATGARAAVLVVSPYGTRAEVDHGRVEFYDVRAVPSLFTLGEVLAAPRFHLAGIAAQSHVLIRQQWALRQAAQVWLGRTSWARLELDSLRGRLRAFRRGEFGPILEWFRARVPETYPNPNTRAIRYLARRLRAHGGRLVLMESPPHPVLDLVMASRRLAPFRAHMTEIARREGLVYVTGDDLPALEPEDFEDQTHLNARGRARVTAVVAARLRDVL